MHYLVELYSPKPAWLALPTYRQGQFSPALVLKQKRLQTGALHLLEATPLLNRHQNGNLFTPFGDKLRPLLQAGLQQLAKPCLRILNWPITHRHSPKQLARCRLYHKAIPALTLPDGAR